jgi:hypothetical protein
MDRNLGCHTDVTAGDFAWLRSGAEETSGRSRCGALGSDPSRALSIGRRTPKLGHGTQKFKPTRVSYQRGPIRVNLSGSRYESWSSATETKSARESVVTISSAGCSMRSSIQTLKADARRERRLRDGEWIQLVQAAKSRQNPYVSLIMRFALVAGSTPHAESCNFAEYHFQF